MNGEAQALAVVGVDTPDFGKTTGKFNYTLTNEDINKSGGGNIQFTVGIMDAKDTCVTSSLKLYDFNVSSAAAVESDFSGKGLIDGLDAYMASESVTEIKNEDGEVTTEGTILKLSAAGSENSDGQTLGEDTSDNWNIGGLTQVFSLNSFGGFETLGVGTGSNNGKVAIWTTDSNGEIIDEDIDTLDDSEAWVSIAEATANGYEEKFGKDLDLNGLVSSGTGSDDGIVLKNSSDSFDNVALTDANGAISQAGTETFTVEKAISSQGFQLFNSAATGYQLYLKGKGTKFGKIGIAEVTASGVMGEIEWQSNNDIDSIENLFNEDIDGNNLISGESTYQLVNEENKKVVFKSKKGVAYNDQTSSLWDAKASTDANGKLKVIVEGSQGKNKDGQLKVLAANENGIYSNSSNWKEKSAAIESGWENTFNYDIDKNGLITGENYKAVSTFGTVEITNKNGNGYDNDSNNIWDAVSAAQTNKGFKVFLAGEDGKSKEDQYKVWNTNDEGVIKNGSKWTSTTSAVNKGWENTFDYDLDNNGLITGGKYKAVGSNGTVLITNKNGGSYKNSSNSSWNAAAATEVSGGYKVILEGEDGGSKEDEVKVWKTDEDGVIKNSSNWISVDSAVNKGWENTFSTDLDNNGLISGGKYKVASSTGAVLITNKNGGEYDDNFNSVWNASAAVEYENGYKILLAGVENKSKEGQVKVWTANKDGVLINISGWEDAEAFFEEDDYFSSVELPEYFESEDSEGIVEGNSVIANLNGQALSLASSDNITGIQVDQYSNSAADDNVDSNEPTTESSSYDNFILEPMESTIFDEEAATTLVQAATDQSFEDSTIQLSSDIGTTSEVSTLTNASEDNLVI